jgi:hypothetical protein
MGVLLDRLQACTGLLSLPRSPILIHAWGWSSRPIGPVDPLTVSLLFFPDRNSAGEFAAPSGQIHGFRASMPVQQSNADEPLIWLVVAASGGGFRLLCVEPSL